MSEGTVLMGTIVAYALPADNLERGGPWLLCDGSVIDPKWHELIAALGSNNTPNLGGRTLIGTGVPDNGKQTDGSFPDFDPSNNWPVGFTGGEYRHTLIIGEMPAHDHSLGNPFLLSGGCPGGNGQTPCTDPNGNPMTQNTGGGGAHNTMQPYQAVNYIIYAGTAS